jgi:hypothetical protein
MRRKSGRKLTDAEKREARAFAKANGLVDDVALLRKAVRRPAAGLKLPRPKVTLVRRLSRS